jgi:hypothetical protein
VKLAEYTETKVQKNDIVFINRRNVSEDIKVANVIIFGEINNHYQNETVYTISKAPLETNKVLYSYLHDEHVVFCLYNDNFKIDLNTSYEKCLPNAGLQISYTRAASNKSQIAKREERFLASSHENIDLQLKLDSALKRVRDLESSTSWRITKPLRMVMELARKGFSFFKK